MADCRPFEIAALGRPLYPGMLYDCRSDSFIPGVTLWDKKALHDDVDVHRQPKTHLTFSACDSLSDKANLMDVSASLKASFLGGLVEVGGSAKFLHDTKSSAKQSRVTLHYSQTTRFEQLTMAELGKITYPQVFDQRTATHVVTGVLYGAQAFMVFDYTAKNNEDRQEVEGNLEAVIKKIPTISIEGKASLKLNDGEKQMAENIDVTFHGDYELEKNPTTYQEALQLYSDLPHLLREKESDAVPIKVWLHPLKLLDDKAATLVRQISVNLISKTERLLEELRGVEKRCNDLTKNRVVDEFPDLKGRLQVFQDLYTDYNIAFQKALFRVLPAIRNGTQEELVLANILSTHSRSPFAANNLHQWLDDIETELKILSSYITGLKDLRVVPSIGQLNAILFDPDVDTVVGLSFTSLKYKDTYLDVLKDFVYSEGLTLEKANAKPYSPQVTQPWFTSSDISSVMRQNLSLFTRFYKANKNEKRMQFIITSISDPNNPGTSITLYDKGKLRDPKFQPVSKPPPPVVEYTEGGITLKLQKSPTGETVLFRVEYMMIKAGEANQEEKWEIRDTSDAQKPFILTDLIQTGAQYWVRYKAVGVVGVSEVSDSVRAGIQSRMCYVLPPPRPITDDDLNPCILVGGTGGGDRLLMTRDAGGTVRKISLSLGTNTVDSMIVTLSNQQQMSFGQQKGQPYQEITVQDGDRFRSLTLWPNTYGDRFGGLLFELVRKTGQIETFSAKIQNSGNPQTIDVGSGICCGVKLRSGLDIDALGFLFIKKSNIVLK